jgi:YesN/AraC family two-component response regulator
MIILFLKILVSPEILFGYNALYKKINAPNLNTLLLSDLWILSQPIINNVQDEQLRSKIVEKLEFNLSVIEDLAFNKKWFRNPNSKQDMLAIELEIPKSHVGFIFKYHSKMSYTEFRKIIRVYDSIQLMEENYLKANTLESLASKVGFSSYNPFFTTFKDVTGTTPQNYNRKVLFMK